MASYVGLIECIVEKLNEKVEQGNKEVYQILKELEDRVIALERRALERTIHFDEGLANGRETTVVTIARSARRRKVEEWGAFEAAKTSVRFPTSVFIN